MDQEPSEEVWPWRRKVAGRTESTGIWSPIAERRPNATGAAPLEVGFTMVILSEPHRAELEQGSGISPEIVAERGYFTARHSDDVPPAFADWQRRPGLVVPIRDVTGRVAAWQLKADTPRRDKNGRGIKYDTAVGGKQCLDIPVRCLPLIGDPRVPLWLSEGAKKLDSGLTHGIRCIIGVQGVYGWRGTNAHGGKAALPDWESIGLNGRDVVLAFDSDCMTNGSVRDALERLSAFLAQRGAHVRYLLLPPLGDREAA